MGKNKITIMEPEDLPQFIINWIQPRLGPDETIKLCFQEKTSTDKNADLFELHILTSQKLIVIHHFLGKKDGTAYSNDHNARFLCDIKILEDSYTPWDDRYILGLATINHDSLRMELDSNTYIKFTEILYQLLAKIKPGA
jgi:hypothetical protein